MPYENGVPYVEGSDTSRKAAQAAQSMAKTLRDQVCAHATALGPYGMTRQEICKATGLKNETVCPRVRELLRDGRLVTLVETRGTDAKNDAHVLVAPMYVQGREVEPFVEYRTIAVDAFNDVFGEFDADWRLERWEAMKKRSKRKPKTADGPR